MKVFGFGKAKCLCGMTVEKNTAIKAEGNFFCSQNCVEEFRKKQKNKSSSCCH